jgi:hypothetical protein
MNLDVLPCVYDSKNFMLQFDSYWSITVTLINVVYLSMNILNIDGGNRVYVNWVGPEEELRWLPRRPNWTTAKKLGMEL